MNTSMSKRLIWSEDTIDPIKRAKSIKDAIDKKRIKRSDIMDDTLRLIDEIVAQETKQTA